MGRMLGYFDSDELDRPELNKCPDCECYFASEECPLCGKLCPENMRAGNRAAVKKPKKKQNSSGRVQFIPWYHTWWFILIMMFLMPIIGIILFFSSPYSKKVKIIGAVIGILYFVLVYMGLGWKLLNMALSEDPVNDKLSREAYMETCQFMEATEFYRMADNEDAYVCMTLTVREVLTDQYSDSEYTTYYLCASSDSAVTILVRDCRIGGGDRLLKGDAILVYGEGDGDATVYPDFERVVTAPCLNMAYAKRVQ